MQDLTPSEIEALTKAMGKPATHSAVENHHQTQGYGTRSQQYENIPPPQTISHAQFTQFHETHSMEPAFTQERLHDLKIHVDAILGQKTFPLGELMKLHNGSVIPLDKLAGELIDIKANGKLIARGEVVVVEENYGIRIVEIL